MRPVDSPSSLSPTPGRRHYLAQHPRLAHFAEEYLRARIKFVDAANAKLSLDLRVLYLEKTKAAHEAVCNAMGMSQSGRLTRWDAEIKRPFVIERLFGAFVISIADEHAANADGMEPISRETYLAMVTSATVGEALSPGRAV